MIPSTTSRPTSTPNHETVLVALLALLTAFDAMAIDMYLPAFPSVQQSLATDPATMRFSLSIFLAGLAIGQALYGPLIDRFGRKRPLLIGIALFAVASVLVAISEHKVAFLAARLLQGLGGAAGLVIPRAVIADLYTPRRAAKVFAVLMQIMALAPVLAPLLGSALTVAVGWRGIFWALALIALAALAATWRLLPETLPPTIRSNRPATLVFNAYKSLISDRRLLGCSLSSGFALAGLFAYIGSSSILFMDHLGFSPGFFSVIFAGNALGMILSSWINGRLLRGYDSETLLRNILPGYCFTTLALLVSLLCAPSSALLIGTFIFLSVSCLGPILSNGIAAAMQAAPPPLLGTASALLGVLQYALGGAAGFVTGLIAGATGIGWVMAGCALAAWLAWLAALRAPLRSPSDHSSVSEGGG